VFAVLGQAIVASLIGGSFPSDEGACRGTRIREYTVGQKRIICDKEASTYTEVTPRLITGRSISSFVVEGECLPNAVASKWAIPQGVESPLPVMAQNSEGFVNDSGTPSHSTSQNADGPASDDRDCVRVVSRMLFGTRTIGRPTDRLQVARVVDRELGASAACA